MKHSTSRDLTVFDFNEEEEVAEETWSRWSKISNPNSEDSAIKYQFLQYASAASIAQMSGGHMVEHVVVTIDDDDDDDDNGFVSDIAPAPLDLLKNATLKQSEGFDATSDKTSIEDAVNPENSCQDEEVNLSKKFRSLVGNDLMCSIIPETPSSSGSVNARTPDGHDTIQENSSSTPTSPVKEHNVRRDVEVDDQPASGSEMQEEVDTVVLDTDYVTYSNKYFPASQLLFSKSSVKVKPLSFEDESPLSRLEWEINDVVSIEAHWCSLIGIANVRLHLSTKDASQDGSAQDAPAVEVLEFVVCDPGWLWKQERIMSLDTRYERAWSIGLKRKGSDGDAILVDKTECSSYPYIPNFIEPFEEVVYPEGDIDAVSISKRDVDLLEPETFVNDTIIDFYIKYLKNQIPSQERHRYHFFNSFFFRKLADLDKNPLDVFDSKAAFQRVRKWTRKVNLFEKDYIFIPVNYNLHWSLIVICHPGEVAKLNCESTDESLKVPCILHMDSIRGSHMGLKDLVQSYLLEEWKERQKETSEEISSNFLNLRFLSLELPQQENCSDCGLFLLHYVELFIAEAPENFNPFMINKFENFLKPDWFMPAEASLKRVHIQRLIYELLASRTRGSTPPCHHKSNPLTQPKHNEDDNIEIISEKRSPRKSWNANPSYSQSVHALELGMLDVSLYRTYDSDPGVQEHLEHSQHYEQGQSFRHLQSQSQPIREEADANDCGIGYSDGFAWNSETSDHATPDGNSSPTSNCPSDDSQDMEIIEFYPREEHGANSGQNQNLGHRKDSMQTESTASASSDMMENPAENEQKCDTFERSNRQDPEDEQLENKQEGELLSSDQEEELHQHQEDEPLKNNQEELHQHQEDGPSMANQEEELHEDHEDELRSSDRKLVTDEDYERMVVKDSSSDSDEEQAAASRERMVVEDTDSDSDEEGQAAKRLRLDAWGTNNL